MSSWDLIWICMISSLREICWKIRVSVWILNVKLASSRTNCIKLFREKKIIGFFESMIRKKVFFTQNRWEIRRRMEFYQTFFAFKLTSRDMILKTRFCGFDSLCKVYIRLDECWLLFVYLIHETIPKTMAIKECLFIISFLKELRFTGLIWKKKRSVILIRV